MTIHKFCVGQKVSVSPGAFDFHTPHGVYEIVRLLPTDEDDSLYRVKSIVDGHERAVRESQFDHEGRCAVEALAQSLYEASDTSGTPWAKRSRTIRDAWVAAARKKLPKN